MGLKNTYQTRKRFTKVPVSKTGMWYQDGDVVVPSNQITMKGPNGEPNYFSSPIMGTGMQSGQTQVMYPGREYSFPNDNSVYERKMKGGGWYTEAQWDSAVNQAALDSLPKVTQNRVSNPGLVISASQPRGLGYSMNPSINKQRSGSSQTNPQPKPTEQPKQLEEIDITDAVRSLRPQEPKFSGLKNVLNTADLVTDVMQLGHFIPHPIGQAVGYAGDYLGAGVDFVQSGINIAERDYEGAAINAALGVLPGVTGKQGYKRSNSLINHTTPGTHRPLTALPHLRNNPVVQRGLMWNRATLGANALEVGSNLNFNNTQSTSPVRYQDNIRISQDNTRMSSNVRPFVPKMQSGGLFPVGPYDEMMAPKQGNYLQPDINRPYYIDDFGGMRSEYKMGFNDKGKETLIPTVVNGRQLTEDQAINNYFKTGLNMGKYNSVDDAEYASKMRTAKYNMFQDPIRFQMQIGGETSTEQNPVRMNPINISAKRRNQDYKTYQDNTVNNNQIVPSEFRGRRYIQPTLSEYVEPNIGNRILNTLASPMTALSNNRTGSRNPFDYALDMVNPFSWIQSGERAVGSLSEGQYGDAALNALGALPALGFADDAGRALSKAGKYATTKTPLKNARKLNTPKQLSDSGNYQNILDRGLDVHDVRLKYHNNMVLDFDEFDMLNKFGKGNKKNYERALVEDVAGSMHTEDVFPKTKNVSEKTIIESVIGKEQAKVAIPDKNVKPFQLNEDIKPITFEQEQNIVKPPKVEIPSFFSEPYQRTSTSRAADKWLEDWFYNSETKQKFIDYGGVESEWEDILNSLENPIKSNYTWGKNQPGGVYVRPFNQASIPLDATVDIGVHEGIHKAKLLLDQNNPVLHKLWNDFTDAVRLTPAEAYPEIFRFRQKLGLKPGQNIDLKTMEDNLHLISDGYSMPYKIKDKNKLLEIINKAPAAAPIVGGVGLGASQLQEKKYGGLQMSYLKTKRFK